MAEASLENGATDAQQTITSARDVGHANAVDPAGDATVVESAGNATAVEPTGNATAVEPTGNATAVDPAADATVVEHAAVVLRVNVEVVRVQHVEVVRAQHGEDARITQDATRARIIADDGIDAQHATEPDSVQHATEPDSVQHATQPDSVQHATDLTGVQHATDLMGIQHAVDLAGVQQADKSRLRHRFLTRPKLRIREGIDSLGLFDGARTIKVLDSVRALNLRESVRTLNLRESVRTLKIRESVQSLNLVDCARALNLVDGARALNLVDGAKSLRLVDSARALRLVDGAKALKLVDGARTAFINTWSAKQPLVLAELPLDVVHEIFTHLHPADLLSVSRINKTLRGMLLQRSARWIWRASFANVNGGAGNVNGGAGNGGVGHARGGAGHARGGAGDAHGGPGDARRGPGEARRGPGEAYKGPVYGCPEVPDDLTEPQFARFLFDELCMNCSRPGGIYIAWTMRMRYCDICVSTSDIFGTIEQALSQGGHPGRVLISNFVPALHCKGNVDLFVRSEVEAFVDTLMELQVRGAPPDVVSAWLELQRRRCRQAYEHMMWLDEWKRERDKIHLEAETREACRVWAQATYKKAVQPRIMGRFDSLVFECVVC